MSKAVRGFHHFPRKASPPANSCPCQKGLLDTSPNFSNSFSLRLCGTIISYQLSTVDIYPYRMGVCCVSSRTCQIRAEKYAPCLVSGQRSAFGGRVKYNSTWDWGNTSSLLLSVFSIVKIFPFFILFATELPITLLSRHQFQSSSDVHLPPQWHKSLQRIFLHTPCQRDGQYHG